ncbi:Protein of unknown function [Anaplasma phagocytophilum]|uniref:Uncharacterized protein n=1 Tax=Anaplasma phagocytophilum TaxID=948 RepID=A0A098EFM1_ANAPH|nr:Protein of unknown function [Anaplasma phagocytophilum]
MSCSADGFTLRHRNGGLIYSALDT